MEACGGRPRAVCASAREGGAAPSVPVLLARDGVVGAAVVEYLTLADCARAARVGKGLRRTVFRAAPAYHCMVRQWRGIHEGVPADIAFKLQVKRAMQKLVDPGGGQAADWTTLASMITGVPPQAPAWAAGVGAGWAPALGVSDSDTDTDTTDSDTESSSSGGDAVGGEGGGRRGMGARGHHGNIDADPHVFLPTVHPGVVYEILEADGVALDLDILEILCDVGHLRALHNTAGLYYTHAHDLETVGTLNAAGLPGAVASPAVIADMFFTAAFNGNTKSLETLQELAHLGIHPKYDTQHFQDRFSSDDVYAGIAQMSYHTFVHDMKTAAGYQLGRLYELGCTTAPRCYDTAVWYYEWAAGEASWEAAVRRQMIHIFAPGWGGENDVEQPVPEGDADADADETQRPGDHANGYTDTGVAHHEDPVNLPRASADADMAGKTCGAGGCGDGDVDMDGGDGDVDGGVDDMCVGEEGGAVGGDGHWGDNWGEGGGGGAGADDEHRMANDDEGEAGDTWWPDVTPQARAHYDVLWRCLSLLVYYRRLGVAGPSEDGGNDAAAATASDTHRGDDPGAITRHWVALDRPQLPPMPYASPEHIAARLALVKERLVEADADTFQHMLERDAGEGHSGSPMHLGGDVDDQASHGSGSEMPTF